MKLRFQLVFQAEVGRALGELQAAVMLFYLGHRAGRGSGHPQELQVTGPGLLRDQVGPGPGGSGGRCPGPAALGLCPPSQPIQQPLPVPLLSPPISFIAPPRRFAIPSQSIHSPLSIHSQSPPNLFRIPSQPLCPPSSPFANPAPSLCHPLPAPPPRLPLPPGLKMELLPRPQQGLPGVPGPVCGPDPPPAPRGFSGFPAPRDPRGSSGAGAKLPGVPTLCVAAPG